MREYSDEEIKKLRERAIKYARVRKLPHYLCEDFAQTVIFQVVSNDYYTSLQTTFINFLTKEKMNDIPMTVDTDLIAHFENRSGTGLLKLNDQYRKVFYMTLACFKNVEIAEVLGISQQRVSQIYQRILNKLT